MKMKDFLQNTWKHRAHVVMALPAFLILLFFSYIPMAGLVMAFKSFDYSKGIWTSPWNGIENFKFLLASKSTFITMTKNTLMYYVIFTALGTFLNVVIAIAIDQCVFKKASKAMQTVMIIPVFISYAAVQFIVYAYLSTDTGILNNTFNIATRFYSTPKAWPWILTIVKMWNSVGYGSVLYMSVLAGIDTSLYEAAEIDGANKWQQFWYIILPNIKTIVSLNLILAVKGAISVYEIPMIMTNGANQSATFVMKTLDTAFTSRKIGLASAMGVVLLVFIMIVTFIQKRFIEGKEED